MRAAVLLLATLLAPGCAEPPDAGFATARYVADGAQAQTDLRFQPGAARLAAGEAERLSSFLRGLVLRPGDDVVLSFGPSGSPMLDRQRVAAAEAATARSGTPARIRIADTRGFGRGPDRGDRVLVQAIRHDVLLVLCPGLAAARPAMPAGCANAANRAHMAASVRDLTEPRALGPAPAAHATSPLRSAPATPAAAEARP